MEAEEVIEMDNNIKLNEIEQDLAQKIGKMRYENARNKGIIDRKMGDQSCYETDLEGMAAEIAFCKLLNIYPDLHIGLDRDYDCVFRGKKIDVKTTKYKTGKLLATLKKKNADVDIYVLVIGSFPGPYKIVGWVTKDEMFSDKNIRNLGKGDGYCVEQKDLRNIKDLENVQ